MAAGQVSGARGNGSSVDRALNRRFLRKSQPFVGLKAHFRGSRLPGRIELYTFPGGYCGMSEVEGGRVNVCLLVRDSVLRAGSVLGSSDSSALDHFIQWIRWQNPNLDNCWSQAA